MKLGYNTNGLAHHELLDAINLLADIGYEAIALTLDHHVLNPFDSLLLEEQRHQVKAVLRDRQLAIVIETGARYLLDPREKHEPTLVSAEPAGRQRRLEFLQQAIEIAAQLDATCVSFWSGLVHDGAGQGVAFQRLVDGIAQLIDFAGERGVTLGFEPEPGMLIDTMDSFVALLDRLDDAGVDGDSLELTIDIGHLHCMDEVPIGDEIRRWADRLVNVHIEDMRRGIHEHLMFGDGEIDFPPIIAALSEIGYGGPVCVELSRHSHVGPLAAQRSYDFLHPLVAQSR